MNIHGGHRERLRGNFLENGLQGMSDITALELLLFYAIPRRDTNPTAHLLLRQFGSLEGVFQASARELCEVDGIGESAAALLTLVPQIMKKSAVSRTKEIRQIRSSEDAGRFLLPYFLNEQEEVLLLLCLDAKRSILCCEEIARGVVNAVETSIRRIVERALKARACSVILAHNHPGGLALPSREDEVFTKCLVNALETVGICLTDHIIVADGDFVSIADTGLAGLGRR